MCNIARMYRVHFLAIEGALHMYRVCPVAALPPGRNFVTLHKLTLHKPTSFCPLMAPEEKPQIPDPGTFSEADMERFLFEEKDPWDKSQWNVPMIAGLVLILVGVTYIVQEMGLWGGINIGGLVQMLPWLAGILIILLGFGVLSWRPRKKYKLPKVSSRARGPKKILTKSRDKKISGVAAGLAEYFNLDATLVRVAFVILLIFTGGPPAVITYLLLAFILPRPDKTEEL